MTTSSPAGAVVHARAYRKHQLWTLLLATVAFAASAPGQSFLISVFVDDLLADTGLSRTVFSVLYAAGTVVSAAAMVWVGRLVDRRGLRVAWFAVSTGLVVAAVMASLVVGAVTVFAALALLRTSGQGSFPLLGTLLVAGSFERRRARAMASANLGLTAASIVLPPLVAWLIVTTDWRTAYRLLALAVAVVVVPLGALVRPGPPRRRPAGQPPAPGDGPSRALRVTRRGRSVPTAATTRFLVVLAAPPLIGTAVTLHAVSILGPKGIGYLEAGGLVGLLGAASAVGVVAAGALVDRLDARGALLLPTLTVLLGTAALLTPAAAGAYVAFVLLGFGMGSVGVVNGTLWAHTFGLVGLGRLQGLAQSSMIAAAAVGPLVPAASLALTGSHQGGVVVLTATAGLAAALAATSRVR